jgi:GNAT superfamily N-acetyltransferase
VPKTINWQHFSEALINYYNNPQNIGTVPKKTDPGYADDDTKIKLGLLLQNYRSKGFPKDCPQSAKDLMTTYGVVGPDYIPNIVQQKKPFTYDQLCEALKNYYSNPDNIGTVPKTRDLGYANDRTEINLGYVLKSYQKRGFPKDCPQSAKDLMTTYGVVGPDYIPNIVQQKNSFTYDQLCEALKNYYSNPDNIGTVPKTKDLGYANDRTEINLGHVLQNYRSKGFPQDCPQSAKDLMTTYGVVGPDYIPNIVQQKKPFTYDQLCEALKNYYSNPDNIGAVPKIRDLGYANDRTEINLGHVLQNYRRNGFPQDCPQSARDLMTAYCVVGPGYVPNVVGKSSATTSDYTTHGERTESAQAGPSGTTQNPYAGYAGNTVAPSSYGYESAVGPAAPNTQWGHQPPKAPDTHTRSGRKGP